MTPSPAALTAIATVVASLLVAFGVPADLTDAIRTAAIAVAGLVAAVYVHAHHQTARASIDSAHQLAIAKLQVSAASQGASDAVTSVLGPLLAGSGGAAPAAASTAYAGPPRA